MSHFSTSTPKINALCSYAIDSWLDHQKAKQKLRTNLFRFDWLFWSNFPSPHRSEPLHPVRHNYSEPFPSSLACDRLTRKKKAKQNLLMSPNQPWRGRIPASGKVANVFNDRSVLRFYSLPKCGVVCAETKPIAKRICAPCGLVSIKRISKHQTPNAIITIHHIVMLDAMFGAYMVDTILSTSTTTTAYTPSHYVCYVYTPQRFLSACCRVDY